MVSVSSKILFENETYENKGKIGTLSDSFVMETGIHRILWSHFGYLFFDRNNKKKQIRILLCLNGHFFLNGSCSEDCGRDGGSNDAYNLPMHLNLLFLLIVVVVIVVVAFFSDSTVLVERLFHFAVTFNQLNKVIEGTSSSCNAFVMCNMCAINSFFFFPHLFYILSIYANGTTQLTLTHALSPLPFLSSP